MKRLITLILILALAVPALTFAEDKEPIIGCWYLFFDSKVTPEFASAFENYDYIIAVYTFLEDGTIACTENDVKNGSGTPLFSAAGKWEKDGSKYKCSIIGFGEGSSYVEEDALFIQTQTPNTYLKLHKLIPLNPYADYEFH